MTRAATDIDWERIVALTPTIERVGQYYARRAGRPDDGDETAARIRQAIIEQASKNPDFLHKQDNFVITYGVWRMLDSFRTSITTVPLQDHPDLIQPTNILDDISIRRTLRALPPDLQELVKDILYRDGVLKRNGRLNVAALCRLTGRARRLADGQLARLRAAFLDHKGERDD